MGIINETNSEYYSGEKLFSKDLLVAPWVGGLNIETKQMYYSLDCSSFNTDLHDRGLSTPPTMENYYVDFDANTNVPPFSFTRLDNEADVTGALNMYPSNGFAVASNITKQQIADLGYSLMLRILPSPVPFFPSDPGAPLPNNYSALVSPTTSGSGTGAKIWVTMSANGDGQFYIVKQGKDYAVGDTLTIPQNSIAAGVPSVDLVSIPLVEEELYTGRIFNVENNVVTFENLFQPYDYSSIPTSGSELMIKLSPSAIANNYGGYSYISLGDVINNFMIGYVGYEKTIARANKTDVMFHAKRGLQEFSYDLLKVVKSQELTIPPSLCIPIPQDYVNYVRMSWIDDNGGKHIIYPTRVTSNPTELPIQDNDGIPMQDYFGDNLEAGSSITDDRWADQQLTTNYQNEWNIRTGVDLLGKRYGLQPEEAQVNGKFTIDERLGKFCFTSDLVDKLIILEYVSDGLAYSEDMKVPKMAEEAIYMHIAHAILSTRRNTPEYIINRYKRERSAAYRNAKIRLSNIKIGEISQVMRNKAKWIKH